MAHVEDHVRIVLQRYKQSVELYIENANEVTKNTGYDGGCPFVMDRQEASI